MKTMKIESLKNALQSVVFETLNSFFRQPLIRSFTPDSESANFICGIPALADFLGCDYPSARNLVRRKHIPVLKEGNICKFYIIDILHAIETDPLVNSKCTKTFDFKTGLSTQVKPFRSVPKITNYVIPGKLPISYISYQGWRCFICVPLAIYKNADLFEEYIKTVILIQHKKKPFFVAPIFSDEFENLKI